MANLDRYIFESEEKRTEWITTQGYKTPKSNLINVFLSNDENGFYVDCLLLYYGNVNYCYSDNFGNRGNYGKFGY